MLHRLKPTFYFMKPAATLGPPSALKTVKLSQVMFVSLQSCVPWTSLNFAELRWHLCPPSGSTPVPTTARATGGAAQPTRSRAASTASARTTGRARPATSPTAGTTAAAPTTATATWRGRSCASATTAGKVRGAGGRGNGNRKEGVSEEPTVFSQGWLCNLRRREETLKRWSRGECQQQEINVWVVVCSCKLWFL